MEKEHSNTPAIVTGSADSIQYFAKKMLIAETIKKSKKKKIIKFWSLFETYEEKMRSLISERIYHMEEVKAYYSPFDENKLIELAKKYSISEKKYRDESAKFKNKTILFFGKSIAREVRQIIVDVEHLLAPQK